MPLWIKLCFPAALLCLSGCASYVADKISRDKGIALSGDLEKLTQPKTICDDDAKCIDIHASIPYAETGSTSLQYNIKINNNHKVWRYIRKETQPTPLTGSERTMAIIFPGYGQPAQILAILAQWLSQESDIDVYIVNSANRAEHFQFGLESVNPIVAMIKHEHPSKVKLIGFSMGAVAANAIAQQIDNAELHLVAPMTNFEQSTLGVSNAVMHDSYYRFFVSQDTLKEAVRLVHKRAQLSPSDIDITSTASHSGTPAHIYLSSDDTVTPAQNWQNIESKIWQLHSYPGLNHMEMITLLENELFLSFAANLLGKEADASNIATFGLMCDADDDVCMSQEL